MAVPPVLCVKCKQSNLLLDTNKEYKSETTCDACIQSGLNILKIRKQDFIQRKEQNGKKARTLLSETRQILSASGRSADESDQLLRLLGFRVPERLIVSSPDKKKKPRSKKKATKPDALPDAAPVVAMGNFSIGDGALAAIALSNG